jgi:hypothetical protein
LVACGEKEQTTSMENLAELLKGIEGREIDPRQLIGYLKSQEPFFGNETLKKQAPSLFATPSKTSVEGMLSSTFFTWQDYENAFYFAKRGHQLHGDLTSRNILAASAYLTSQCGVISKTLQTSMVQPQWRPYIDLCEGRTQEVLDSTNKWLAEGLPGVDRRLEWSYEAVQISAIAQSVFSPDEYNSMISSIMDAYFGRMSLQHWIQKLSEESLDPAPKILSEHVAIILHNAVAFNSKNGKVNEVETFGEVGFILTTALAKKTPWNLWYSEFLLGRFKQFERKKN